MGKNHLIRPAALAAAVLITLMAGLTSPGATAIAANAEPTVAAETEDVYFKADENGFRFGNSYLERCFELENETWRTAWLVNRLTGHTWRTRSSEEFRIRFTYERLGFHGGLENPVVIGASDCLFRGYRIEPLQNGVRRLVLSYLWQQGLVGPAHSSADQRSPGLDIEVAYTLADTLPWMRKSLKLSCPGGKYYFIEELAVEELSVPGAECIHQGFGQPVYTGEIFFGLEYPAGNNRMTEGGSLSLYYYPGKAVGRSGIESYSAVWGVADSRCTRAAFLEYVDKIRVSRPEPFLLYNTWYDMRTAERAAGVHEGGLLDYTSSLERIESFNKNLVSHGIKLQSFVLDEGWDRYTPFWEVDKRNFPGGLGKLQKALKSIGSRLGLWVGPIGGYGEGLHLRSARGRKAGLEVSHKGYLDHAGPKYRRILLDRLLEYIQRYDVNYYKFDGLIYGYADTDHGILPGVYSREAHTASLISILDTLHAVKPGIFTNITTSQWLSPWWLMHAECVFLGGEDYGWLETMPAISKRDQAISYRDHVCYDRLRTLNAQFPMNSIMTVGVIKGEYQMLGEPGETLDKWTNNLVMHFSRGVSMWELYISPQILSAEEWESLRSAVRWARANKDVLLDNTTMVGGDPAGREPYGFFHCGDEKMILTVRNPYLEPAVFRMKLDYDNGWLGERDEAFLAVAVYPHRRALGNWLSYGEVLEAPLTGYETRVIEFLRRDMVDFPIPQGVAFEFEKEGIVLYPEDGAESVTFENSTPDELTVAGRSVPPGVKLELTLEPVSAEKRLKVAHTRTGGGGGSVRLDRPSGEMSLTLPGNVEAAELAFLLELEDGLKGVEPVLTVDGKTVACRTETDGSGSWYFFTAALDPGISHTAGYNFTCNGSHNTGGTLSCWLIAHTRLEGRRIEVPGLTEQLSDKRNSLPESPSVRRAVECVFKRPVRF